MLSHHSGAENPAWILAPSNQWGLNERAGFWRISASGQSKLIWNWNPSLWRLAEQAASQEISALWLFGLAWSWNPSAGRSFSQPWKTRGSFLRRQQQLESFPAGFPIKLLGKPAKNIENNDHMIMGYLATTCEVYRSQSHDQMWCVCVSA